MENETEMIEHNIIVSKHIRLTLDIPKEMNTMEFAGLIEQAKQIFKISNPTLNPVKNVQTEQKVSRDKLIEQAKEFKKQGLRNVDIASRLGRTDSWVSGILKE